MAEEKTPCTEPETKTGGEQHGPRRGNPCSWCGAPKEGRGGLVPASLEGKESET